MSFIGQNMPAPINPAHQMPGGPQMPGQSGVGKPNPAGFDTPDFTLDAGQPLPGMPGRETGLGGKQCGPAKDLEALKSLLSNQGVIKPSVELSECGDVDINIFNKMDVVGPEFLKDFHKNIGKAFIGEKLGLQGKALDLIKGVKDSIVTGQKKTLPEIFKAPEKIKPGLFGKNFDWLKKPLIPGGGAKLPPQAEVKIYEFASQSLPQDPMAFVQWVLRESYMENTQSLYDYAEKVRWFNEQKKAVREELESVRNHMAAYPGAEDGDQVGGYQTRQFNLEYSGDMDPKAASDRIKSGQWGETVKYNAIVTESGTDTAAAQAANEAQAAAAKADSAYAEDAAKKEIVSLDPGNFAGKANGHGSQSAVESTISNAADTASGELLSYYNSLSPEEQAAFEAALESEGITYKLKLEEVDQGNSWWHVDKNDKKTLSNTFKKQHGESVEEFLNRIQPQVESEGASWIHGQDSGKSEMGSCQATIVPPKVDNVEVAKYSAEELATMHPDSPAAQQAMTSAVAGNNSGEDFAMGEVADTYGELKTYKTNLEETLNTLGDDAQLANVDLQNWLQKQQQTLQMMSNISKLLHDTAMNTIRKLGG